MGFILHIMHIVFQADMQLKVEHIYKPMLSHARLLLLQQFIWTHMSLIVTRSMNMLPRIELMMTK